MFNQNKFLLLIVCLAILVGSYLLISYSSKQDSPESVELNGGFEVTSEVVESSPLSGFSWRFAEADTNNPDGNPQTKVYLTASYGDGSQVEKLVDTVDGSCSELEGELYEGDISGTGKVQCYYAGLGQQYRVVEGENSYVIERKFSEEALPDYTPPDFEWETVANFEKMN